MAILKDESLRVGLRVVRVGMNHAISVRGKGQPRRPAQYNENRNRPAN
jgi:hypothetical protein